jgi:hypothetical protein
MAIKLSAIKLSDLKVKLFTDGADKAQIVEMAKQRWISGFTTNPSLLKKAGVRDYAAYARDLVAAVPDRHISFEVFSDDIPEMVAQARVITTWGRNVHVKLPVTTTRGEPLYDAVKALSHASLCIGLCRAARRFRCRLSADHAGRGRARQQDLERRDHLGVDAGGFQRRGGPRHGLPHHHGARRCAQEAAGARHAL